MHLILETICGTGIRVSELRFFTAEAVQRGEITVSCKSKTRTILLPGKLKKMLLDHAKKNGIRSGAIFITRNGKPLNRSNLYYQKRKAVEPEQYLGADEIPLQESRSKSQQGVSPQSAQAICTNLLWY